MPAIARDDNDALAAPARRYQRGDAETAQRFNPRHQLALEQHQGISRRQQELHAALTESPSVTHHQIHRTNSTSTSGLGGRISGRIMTRAAGRPMAEPSAPIVSTRLRNNPPKRNTTKKAETQPHDIQGNSPGEQRQTQTDGDADHGQDRSDERGSRVLLRDQIHDDHDD